MSFHVIKTENSEKSHLNVVESKSETNPLANLFRKNNRAKNVVQVNTKLKKLIGAEGQSTEEISNKPQTSCDQEVLKQTETERIPQVEPQSFTTFPSVIASFNHISIRNEINNDPLDTYSKPIKNYKKNKEEIYSDKILEKILNFLQEYEAPFFTDYMSIPDGSFIDFLINSKNWHSYTSVFDKHIPRNLVKFYEEFIRMNEPLLYKISLENTCKKLKEKELEEGNELTGLSLEKTTHTEIAPLDSAKYFKKTSQFDSINLKNPHEYEIEKTNKLAIVIEDTYSLLPLQYFKESTSEDKLSESLLNELNALFFQTDPKNNIPKLLKATQRNIPQGTNDMTVLCSILETIKNFCFKSNQKSEFLNPTFSRNVKYCGVGKSSLRQPYKLNKTGIKLLKRFLTFYCNQNKIQKKLILFIIFSRTTSRQLFKKFVRMIKQFS